jgi:hypothetical protein
MRLQNAIEKSLHLEEGRARKELLSTDVIILLFNMLLEFRDKVDKMKSEPDVLNQLVALKNIYDLKFEMLEERLKRINAKDEEEIGENRVT